MKMKIVVIAGLMLAGTAGQGNAACDLFDLGPGDSYETRVGWRIDPVTPPGPGSVRQEVAMSFIVPAGFDYIFTSLDIALAASA